MLLQRWMMKKSEMKKWQHLNRRRPCCRLHSEACRHCCRCCRHRCRPQSDISPPRVTTRPPPPCPTSSLKYGNAEPSEFHSTTTSTAWVAKWPGGPNGVDSIFTVHTGVDTGQVNLSIRRPFLEKIDSSAPLRSWEGEGGAAVAHK